MQHKLFAGEDKTPPLILGLFIASRMFVWDELNEVSREEMIMKFLRHTSFIIALGFLGLGCQNYPFTAVPPVNDTIFQTQTYISSGPATDILFVVDNSPSMADKQNDLASNAAAFINSVANSNNDYHIGIVTTDLFAGTDNGRLRMAAAGAAKYMSRQGALADPNGVNSVINNFVGTCRLWDPGQQRRSRPGWRAGSLGRQRPSRCRRRQPRLLP